MLKEAQLICLRQSCKHPRLAQRFYSCRGRIGALIAVVVVLVLAVAAVGAELYARSRIEAVIRSALPGLSEDATISVDGLVLPQVMGSRLNTLTIDADSLTLTRTASTGDGATSTSMTLSDLNATLTGVSLTRPHTIDSAAVTGTVAWAEISAIVRARVPRPGPCSSGPLRCRSALG